MNKVIATMLFMCLAMGVQAANPEKGAVHVPGLVAPEPGFGMLYVLREVGIRPDMQFHVYLDETILKERLGYTSGGKYIYFQVPAGKHTLISVGKNTKTLHFEIKDGETLFIRQHVKLDPRDGSNQDPLEILTAEAAQYAMKNLVKGWIDEKQ